MDLQPSHPLLRVHQAGCESATRDHRARPVVLRRAPAGCPNRADLTGNHRGAGRAMPASATARQRTGKRDKMTTLHPRYFIVEQAEIELSTAVTGIIEKHGLTYAELFKVLNAVTASWLKYALRDERLADRNTESEVT